MAMNDHIDLVLFQHTQIPPDLLSLERSPFNKNSFSFLTAELSQGLLTHVDGDILDRPVTDLHAKVHGNLVKFLFVLDLKSGNLTLGRSQKDLGNTTGMIRVGRGSTRHHPCEISSGYGFCRCPATARSFC